MAVLDIWDYRRGDDDNGTIGHGGKLWRVLATAALEFNYLYSRRSWIMRDLA
jgi:hypothetical protein